MATMATPRRGGRGMRWSPRAAIFLTVGALLALCPLLLPPEPDLPSARSFVAATDIPPCETERIQGNATAPAPDKSPIVIDFGAIKARGGGDRRMRALSTFTVPNYRKHMMNEPGREHYALLRYMSERMVREQPTRGEDGGPVPLVDVGTRYASSALALGYSGRRVWTFDLPGSTEREAALGGRSEAAWARDLRAIGATVVFHNKDLLQVGHDLFRRIVRSPLILLDTEHRPYTVPFERQFLWRLMAMGYGGLVLLDDIHLNREMKNWWKELRATAEVGGFKLYDLTPVGHYSGTGLLDFSGRVQIVDG